MGCFSASNSRPKQAVCTDLLSGHELDLDVDSLSRKQAAVGREDLKVKWLLLLLLHLTTQVHWHVALGLNDRKIHFKPIQITSLSL